MRGRAVFSGVLRRILGSLTGWAKWCRAYGARANSRTPELGNGEDDGGVEGHGFAVLQVRLEFPVAYCGGRREESGPEVFDVAHAKEFAVVVDGDLNFDFGAVRRAARGKSRFAEVGRELARLVIGKFNDGRRRGDLNFKSKAHQRIDLHRDALHYRGFQLPLQKYLAQGLVEPGIVAARGKGFADISGAIGGDECAAAAGTLSTDHGGPGDVRAADDQAAHGVFADRQEGDAFGGRRGINDGKKRFVGLGQRLELGDGGDEFVVGSGTVEDLSRDLLVAEFFVVLIGRVIGLGENRCKGFVVVETNYPTVHAEVDVAAGGAIFSAGRRRAAGIDLFQSGGEGNRVERRVDKFKEPVGIVVAGVDFGDGVAIDDQRLRKVRRLDRAAVFGGGEPGFFDLGVARGLRLGGFGNEKFKVEGLAAGKSELRLF